MATLSTARPSSENTPSAILNDTSTLLPNATIGMLGGGQLGRMFALSARVLGYKVVVLEPDPHSPAGQVADQHIQAAYDDVDALAQFADLCDVITTEFENIPAKVLNQLSQSCPVRPSASALEKAQDRGVEKAFIKTCGLLPVPYAEIRSEADFETANAAVQWPAILKTARFGYDGKGQILVNTYRELAQAFSDIGRVPCVLEQRIDLALEISVVLARNVSGKTHCFPVAENIHQEGILYQSIVPARVDSALADSAKAAAQRLADKLDYIGVMAVEFFVTKQGGLLVNEIAPRTHNSGHYSQDACITSQFEQQVRAICNLPFGDSTLLTPVVMTNLLGDVWGDSQPYWDKLFATPQNKLHLYGKKEARIGRKMGHFNTICNDVLEAKQIADTLMQEITPC
jgi:5-(carboxyamino)imidazole ribonucleotide synthase